MSGDLYRQPGAQIGPYVIKRMLGEGYEGVVYLVAPQEDRRKLMTLKLLRGSNMLAQAQHTARHLRQFNRFTAVKRFHEWGVLPGKRQRPYLVFDYVKGTTLATLIAQQRVRDPQSMVLKLLRALAPLHANQLEISDMDFGRNVLVERTGRIVFLDMDAGGPGEPAPQGDDLYEVANLASMMWQALALQPDARVLAALDATTDAITALRAIERLALPRPAR